MDFCQSEVPPCANKWRGDAALSPAMADSLAAEIMPNKEIVIAYAQKALGADPCE